MAHEFIVKKGLIVTGSLNVSGSVKLPDIPQGTTETNIVLKDSNGNLVYKSNLSLSGLSGLSGTSG